MTREKVRLVRYKGANRVMEKGLVNKVVPSRETADTNYCPGRKPAEKNAPIAVKVAKIMINRLMEHQGIDPVFEPQLTPLKT